METEITYNMEDLTEPIGKNEEFEKHLEEGDVITDLDTVDWEAIVEELVEKAERENYKESEALEFELEHRGYKVYRRISDEDTFVIKKEGEMDVLVENYQNISVNTIDKFIVFYGYDAAVYFDAETEKITTNSIK